MRRQGDKLYVAGMLLFWIGVCLALADNLATSAIDPVAILPAPFVLIGLALLFVYRRSLRLSNAE